jgi:hypothetical protein
MVIKRKQLKREGSMGIRGEVSELRGLTDGSARLEEDLSLST